MASYIEASAGRSFIAADDIPAALRGRHPFAVEFRKRTFHRSAESNAFDFADFAEPIPPNNVPFGRFGALGRLVHGGILPRPGWKRIWQTEFAAPPCINMTGT